MIFSKPAEKKAVKARSKPSEYEAMLRNGFILPKLNSTIVNKVYMYRVKSGQEYCPRTSDIKVYKICINPPSKFFMLNEIHQELQRQGDVRDLSYDEKHLPDVEWCVKALLALNPDHAIFNKDYVPGVNEKGRKGQKVDQNSVDEDEAEFQRFEDFEQGLPSHLRFQHQHQHLHQQNHQYQNGIHNSNVNAQLHCFEQKKGIPENAKEEQMVDETITEKDNESFILHQQFNDENQMDILEPVNPFIKSSKQKVYTIPRSNLQISQECGFEILAHSQQQLASKVSKQVLNQKPLDLQSTLKQLNNNLFSPNVSKNKSKKKLTVQEEELIVKMFEKLVVNCKGRPVDFVKSYLDQYHSEKSMSSSKQMTTRSSNTFIQNGSNSESLFGISSKNKNTDLSSPYKYNFGQNHIQSFSFNRVNDQKAEFQSQRDNQEAINQNEKQNQNSMPLNGKFDEDVKMKSSLVNNSIEVQQLIVEPVQFQASPGYLQKGQEDGAIQEQLVNDQLHQRSVPVKRLFEI